MRRIRTIILAGSSVLLLAACATTPPGPMIPVMPGANKSPTAFNADEEACEQYAGDVVQGRVKDAQNSEVARTAVGTAVGAGIGAAVAHNAGRGALVGGALGALVGSTAGTGYDQAAIQRRYDMAYASCMTSRGNEVPGAAPHRPRWYKRHGYAPPPPPPGADGPPPDEQGPPDDQGPPPPPPNR
ncbi:MAG: glycine zipper family protein [Alphaproteobacteria bacterium]|nr:glycine zipper family protein [Alphaproteobacteria bacterium]MBV9063806.1 glycine zipper family protein [Alphaproteobacteria bacterium]